MYWGQNVNARLDHKILTNKYQYEQIFNRNSTAIRMR